MAFKLHVFVGVAIHFDCPHESVGHPAAIRHIDKAVDRCCSVGHVIRVSFGFVFLVRTGDRRIVFKFRLQGAREKCRELAARHSLFRPKRIVGITDGDVRRQDLADGPCVISVWRHIRKRLGERKRQTKDPLQNQRHIPADDRRIRTERPISITQDIARFCRFRNIAASVMASRHVAERRCPFRPIEPLQSANHDRRFGTGHLLIRPHRTIRISRNHSFLHQISHFLIKLVILRQIRCSSGNRQG